MTAEASGTDAAVPPRRRDTVLAAIEIFRKLEIGVTTSNIVTFLYLCENEGIGMTELGALAGLHPTTAARSIRTLGVKGARWALPPFLGLVEVLDSGPTRNSRTLRLTAEGATVRDRINQLIAAAIPITSTPPRG